MVLAVAAVLDVVEIIAGLFAEQAELLGTGYVELLLAPGFIALHAGAHAGAAPFAHVLANVTN